MKCYLCKYINAVGEAIRHTNGTTVFVAEHLRKRLTEDRRQKLCDRHKDNDAYNTDLYNTNSTVSKTPLIYIPLEHIMPDRIVWTPRGDRKSEI